MFYVNHVGMIKKTSEKISNLLLMKVTVNYGPSHQFTVEVPQMPNLKCWQDYQVIQIKYQESSIKNIQMHSNQKLTHYLMPWKTKAILLSQHIITKQTFGIGIKFTLNLDLIDLIALLIWEIYHQSIAVLKTMAVATWWLPALQCSIKSHPKCRKQRYFCTFDHYVNSWSLSTH